MNELIAKIAAHKVIATIAMTGVVGLGVGTGTVLINNGNSNSNCTVGLCTTQVPPGEQGNVPPGKQGKTAPTTGANSQTCPTRPAGNHPKFIAIMVQGIGSYVQTDGGAPITHFGGNDLSGEPATFNPASISYCATSSNWPKDPFAQQGTDPPNNPNTVIRSMADGWLNYSVNFFSGDHGLQQPGYASPDNSTVTPSNGADLINNLAEAGGYILPFSYFAPPIPNFYPASMSGTSANPQFQFFSYNSQDVANGDPQFGDPPMLNFEIASINKVFPNVPIIIIGHSNGGLIAEQWWLRYGTKLPCGNINVLGQPQCGMHGVAHVFTLDAPINGVSQADLCDNGFSLDPVDFALGQAVNLLCSGAIGTTEAGEYSSMYTGNVLNMVPGLTSSPSDPGEGDLLIQFLDTSKTQLPKVPPQLQQYFPSGFHTQRGTFTAVGTYGDPLYDGGDATGAIEATIFSSDRHLGILSQMVFSLPCLQSPDLTSSECAPLKGIGSSTIPPLDFASPCAGSYNGSSPTSFTNEADHAYTPFVLGIGNLPSPAPGVWPIQNYGLPGSIFIHSEAKDCPGTVDMITNYAKTLHPKSAPPPVGACVVPPANAVAAWKATANEAGNLVGASLRQIAGELSCPVRIAELNQLATLPLSELDEGTPQQQAEGNADIKALDNYFGTPGLFPGTGSNTGTIPTPPPTTPPPTLVTPGNGSPGDAVDGFYQSELAGDWAAVCSYVTPSAQALCLAGTSGQGAATGNATVGHTVTSGNEALVSVTGSICAPSSPCVSNSDPSLGMPPSPSQFPADYQAAVANTSGSTTVLSPMPCSQIDGKWYVDFG